MVLNVMIKFVFIVLRFVMVLLIVMDFLWKMNFKVVKIMFGSYVKIGGVWEGGKMESILLVLVWKVIKLVLF